MRQLNLLLQHVYRYGTYKSFPVVCIFQILLHLLEFLFRVCWFSGQYWLRVIRTVKIFQIILISSSSFKVFFCKFIIWFLKPIKWLTIQIYCTLSYWGWGCENYWEVNYLRNVMRSNTANPSLIFCNTFLIVVCSKLSHCSFLSNYLDGRCGNNISHFFIF